MDRILPTYRPRKRPVGWQKWRKLLFIHWPVPVEMLQQLIPHQLTIDTHEGHAYIGLVPFVMEDIHPWWLPFRMNFLETNVRTYVHHEGRDPGVWFFSLDASSWLAVQAARMGWGLAYHHAKMSCGDNYYQSQRRTNGAGLSVNYQVGQPISDSRPESLEYFLLERYLLYAQRRGKLYRGQVHHAPYPAHHATISSIDETLTSAAGVAKSSAPPLVHYSAGVDVEMFELSPI